MDSILKIASQPEAKGGQMISLEGASDSKTI